MHGGEVMPRWGVFVIEDRPVQVCPTDENGMADKFHLLEIDCVCSWKMDEDVLVHEDNI